MSKLENMRSHNRRHMPAVAGIVDELRQRFPGLVVEYASEGDYEMGIRREHDKPAISKQHGCQVVRLVRETDLGLRARRKE